MQIKTKIGIETKVMKEYRIKVRKIIILANELFLLVSQMIRVTLFKHNHIYISIQSINSV